MRAAVAVTAVAAADSQNRHLVLINALAPLLPLSPPLSEVFVWTAIYKWFQNLIGLELKLKFTDGATICVIHNYVLCAIKCGVGRILIKNACLRS